MATNKKSEREALPLFLIKRMRKTMLGVLNFAAGRQVVLKELPPDEGVGLSYIEKAVAYIEIAFRFLFPKDMPDSEKELVLYGVAIHEVLHILRTDFSYAARAMNKFPKPELKARHTFANIVEDAAIEFLRSSRLSDFMNKALTAAIGFFYKEGPSLGEQNSAWAELITALIQFGDVGILKGSFKYPEAEKCFLKCLKKYQTAIVEPDFAKRFALSQEMFEDCRPLWESFMNEQLLTESAVKELLKSLGKDLFSGQSAGKSIPEENGQPASGNGASSAANERRKKTIHLIDEAQAKELERQAEQNGNKTDDPSQAQDIYVTIGDEGNDADENGQNVPVPSDKNEEISEANAFDDSEYEIVDERRKPETSDDSSEDGSAGTNNDSSSVSVSGQQDDSSEDSGSENGEETSECRSSDGNGKESKESGSEGSNGNESSGNPASSSDSASSDETATKEKALENLSGSKGNENRNGSKESVSTETLTDSTDFSSDAMPGNGPETTERKDLGEELRELSKELSDEIQKTGELDISAELSSEMEQSMQREEASEQRAAALEAGKSKTEAIDVTVESPYYKDVRYVNVNSDVPDPVEYERMHTDEVRRLTLSLRAAFKKAFRFQSGQKEYRTSGRVDIPRYCGKKLTARMFYRNSEPKDKTDMAVVIFVDQSGSMNTGFERVKQTLVVLLDSLREFDVKVKVVGFTTHGDVYYYHYGNRKWKNDENLVKCCMQMHTSGGTFLGHALRYTGALLKNRPERNKMFICITDGDPCAGIYQNHSQGMNDCRLAVNEVRKYADVIGVGLYSDKDGEESFRYIFRDACVSMSSLDSLVTELPKKVKKLLGT